MGGRIWLKSEPGKGSSFSFTVAFGNEEDLPKASPIVSTLIKRHKTLDILLVEDEILMSALFGEFLQDTPHNLSTAKNGEEGMETFKTGHFDIILMDLHMPLMDGYTTTQEIRKWEKSQQRKPVPIIALTADVSTEVVKKCLSVGFTAHLGKPVHKSVLLNTINEFGMLINT